MLELLGESARSGNVAAMKELRKYHRERPKGETDGPLAEVDELALWKARRL